jgi:hypothetical protein
MDFAVGENVPAGSVPSVWGIAIGTGIGARTAGESYAAFVSTTWMGFAEMTITIKGCTTSEVIRALRLMLDD